MLNYYKKYTICTMYIIKKTPYNCITNLKNGGCCIYNHTNKEQKKKRSSAN